MITGSQQPNHDPSDPKGTRLCTEINRQVPPAVQGEFSPLRLGKLRIWPPVVLAPMAGVTNYPFRSLCREYGAGLFVSEMITARGFVMGNRVTSKLVSAQPGERPRSIQVYGADPVDLGHMVKALADEGVDHLDINLGCPVPKVTRAGGGSAIPLKPRLVGRLVRAMVANAGDVPITVKMRKGIDERMQTFMEASRVAEEEGAAAVGLHARTAAQLYSGDADWSAITRLKEARRIPVLGNGDIFEAWDALRMMRETGCDAVIVGRGCLGRPWLFRELAQVFCGEEPECPPNLGQILAVMEDHGRRLVESFGEEVGTLQMRKWSGWYIKGFRGTAGIRSRLARMNNLAEIRELVGGLDLDEPFPIRSLRVQRAKGSKIQKVKLPAGYLENLDDDTPPKGPRTLEEIEAWERALSGG